MQIVVLWQYRSVQGISTCWRGSSVINTSLCLYRNYVCKGACHCCIVQVVKGYEQGKLSKHIVGLTEGDTLEFKGPVMKLTYKPNMRKAIGMARPTD